MFVKDRQHEKNSRRQQIIYRMQADAVVGDESLYKIEYVSPTTNYHIPEVILCYESLSRIYF